MDWITKIAHALNQYLSRETSLEDFEWWLLSNLQQILDSSDDRAIELANEMDVLLMKFRDGFVSDIGFFEATSDAFRTYIETVPVSWEPERDSVTSWERAPVTEADTIDSATNFNAAGSEILLPPLVFELQ